ncbi:DUF6970 domain-containing protein [Pseudoxanthomonas indica]|nr:hypothetical protein [Pseudoxanthomonas indica]
MNRILGLALAATTLLACSAHPVGDAAMPDWLQQRIAGYEAGAEHESPSAIWKIRHNGATAYYVVAPCCDQFNPLWDARGDTLCHPSGGFAGHGDGKCPAPKDAGSEATLLWSDPRKPAPETVPP